jgi:glycine C-acetyltransferase
VGTTGRGTAEAQHVLGRVDVVTGTLGKALGGAIGGFVAASTQLATVVRSVSQPYIFSNNPPAPVVAGVLAAHRYAVRPENRCGAKN